MVNDVKAGEAGTASAGDGYASTDSQRPPIARGSANLEPIEGSAALKFETIVENLADDGGYD